MSGQTSRLNLTVLLAALLVGDAHAQQAPRQDDALIVAREVYSVALENPYVLVVKVNVPPGHRSAMHTHQDLPGVIIALGDGSYTLTGEDGIAHQFRQKAGAVAYREAGRRGLATKHQGENPGETPVRAIRVELKDYPPPHELQTIENDSHYAVEIDNQRVRVLRIRLSPREKLRALNLGPRVLVTLSDSGAQHSGDSHWADSGQEPISNPGDSPLEMLAVELKARE